MNRGVAVSGNGRAVCAWRIPTCSGALQGRKGCVTPWNWRPGTPEAALWREALRRIAEQCRWVAGRNPYGRVPGRWCDPRDGGDPSRGQMNVEPAVWPYRNLDKSGHSAGKNKLKYYYYPVGYTMEIMALAGFLRRAAILFNEPAYAAIGQRQIDWILGNNPCDQSFVEGVGYNQLAHVKSGEFIPPTPQIPGAVNTGESTEYDMPPTGWLL